MARGRLYRRAIAGVVVAVAVFAALGYREATAPPVVRRLVLAVPQFPSGAAPVRILLFSDLHVHGPDMPPERVARIVDQINALHPDLIVAAGDFVGDNWVGARYGVAEAIAPLGALKARYGVYAVLGNNDYDAGAAEIVRALEGAGVRVLRNEAVAAGPLAVGGLDGRLYGTRAAWKAARDKAFDALARTPGTELLIVHRPDEFVRTPQSVSLVLAGHTHCGQVVLPIVGALATGSDYGRKYLCGVIREGPKTLVVTAGLGTSHVPLRIGAPPDMWLITVASQGPRASAS